MVATEATNVGQAAAANVVQAADLKVVHVTASNVGQHRSGIDGFIYKISGFCLGFSITILMPIFAAFVTFDVIIMRYLLNMPLTWGMEFTGLMLLALLFLSVTRTEEEDKNIRVEILYDRFPPKLKLFSRILSKILGLLLFGPLSYQSFVMVPDMYQTGQSGIEFMWPLWPLRLLVGLLSLLCFIRLLIDLPGMIRLFFAGGNK